MDKMKLMIEEAYELDSEVVEEINESTGKSEKNYYLEGIFSTPDKKNRNGRIYPRKVWDKALTEWKQKSKENPIYTLGEWEHPSRVAPEPMKAVIKIVEMDFKGDHIIGKAKVLNNNSETTNQIKSLIDEGIKIGISTRGTGRMKGNIVEEFMLSTADLVSSPSNYNSELSGIVESTENYVHMNESTGKWVCNENGCSIEESTSTEQDYKCNCKAKTLQEAFDAFTAEPIVITEKEQKKLEILLNH